MDQAEFEDVAAQICRLSSSDKEILVAEICNSPDTRVPMRDHRVSVQAAERIRLENFRIDPSDRLLLEVGDVVAAGQAIARADISAQLENLESDSEQELGRLARKLSPRKATRRIEF